MANGKKPPWYRFFVFDFDSDFVQRSLDNAGAGIYVRLMNLQWIEGGLSSDPEMLRNYLHAGREEWDRAWSLLEAKFPVSIDGLRRNERLEEERRDMEEYLSRQSENGKRGGRKKQEETQIEPTVNPSLSDEDANNNPSLNYPATSNQQPAEEISEKLELSEIPPPKRAERGLAEETARRYVAVLDAVTGRRTRKLAPDVVKAASARLKDGWEAWQIVAVPILVYAQGRKDRYSPDVFLRNGEHARTRNGNTFGGYYWLARTFERVDGTRLDARLESIAQQAGVLEPLVALGVTGVSP